MAVFAGKGSLLQIQPLYDQRAAWESIAEREDLSYEVLELSTPPALNESGRFDLLSGWFRESGRSRSLHGVFIDINPASGDEEFRAVSRRKCVLSCKAALSLGAQNVVFHSSHLPFLNGPYTANWAASCADYYQELADTFDIALFIENSSDVDPGPLAELMRHCTDPRVGVCLDIGHANYSGTSLEKWFDVLGKNITCLHLSDNHGLKDDHLPLGSGTVDWRKADLLRLQLGKNIPMTLEVGGPEGVELSLAFLKENSLFGCRKGTK